MSAGEWQVLNLKIPKRKLNSNLRKVVTQIYLQKQISTNMSKWVQLLRKEEINPFKKNNYPNITIYGKQRYIKIPCTSKRCRGGF